MKLHGSGVTLCLGYGSTCLEDVGINRSPHAGFLENCSGSRRSRSQRIQAATLGTKLLARQVQGRSSSTTPFRKPISLSAEMNGKCTEASYGHTATKGTCKDSSSTIDSVQGSVTGYKDVSRVDGRAPTSAVARQHVSAAIKADQSSFQSYRSGVLTASCGVFQ